MTRLDFDFHARPARVSRLGVVLIMAGLASLVWVWTDYQAARATGAGLAAHIANIEQSRPRTPTPVNAPVENPEQAARLKVAAQLEYAWEPAFAALAAARTNKIALVSLEAAQAKSQLKLVAEARQLADAVAFIELLQQQPGVKRAALIQHEVQVDDAQKPVRFNVQVELGA